MRKKNSEVIVTGLRELYDRELAAERKVRKEIATKQVALDERILLIQDLQNQYPQISEYLEVMLVTATNSLVSELMGELPYVSWQDREILKAQVEQDRSLDKLTLEELASVLRPYSKENWITKEDYV